MSAHPEQRGAILEQNVRELFAVAYRPVEIRPGFEAEVRRSAAAVLQSATERPRAAGRIALAAAASFVVGALAFSAWERSDVARERIESSGRIAVRTASGPWQAWQPDAGALALRAGPLALGVPAGSVAAVELGAGALELLGPSHAHLAATESGVEIELAAAGLSLRDFQGRLRGAFGELECAAADLELLCEEGGRARARMHAGRVRFEGPDGKRVDLAPGALFDSRGPLLASAPDSMGSALAAAVPAGSGARRPLPPPAAGGATAAASEPALSGAVRDGEGRAVPKFQVLLLREVELPQAAEPVSRAFDAADGRFALDRVDTGATTVFVQADGFALWTRRHVACGTAPARLDVVLERGAGLAGRVVDAATGAPLAGVVLLSEADVPASLLAFGVDACPGNPAALALSEGDGSFRFEHLAESSTVVRATLAGFGARWSAPVTPSESAPPLRLELSAGGTLAGRVEREDGSPWAGAGIVAMPQASVLGLPRRSFGFGFTDAGGAYRIVDLPPGDFVAVRIETVRTREPRAEVRDARIRAGEIETVDFLAPPRGSRLAGRALSASGRPLAAATISIMPVGGPAAEPSVPDAWRSQLCGPDGKFEFTDVLPGRYELFLGVRTPMDVVRVDAVDVGAAANVDRDVRAPAGELRGSVRAALGGAPLGSAVVILETEGGGGACEFAAKLFTADDGTWRAPYLADGSYRVRVYAGRGLAYAGRDGVPVRAGSESASIELALEPGSTLELGVADAAGRPLGRVAVRLFDEDGREFQPAQETATDAAGHLVLEGLPRGRVRLELEAPDGARVERTCVVAPPDAVALSVRFPGGPAAERKE